MLKNQKSTQQSANLCKGIQCTMNVLLTNSKKITLQAVASIEISILKLF